MGVERWNLILNMKRVNGAVEQGVVRISESVVGVVGAGSCLSEVLSGERTNPQTHRGSGNMESRGLIGDEITEVLMPESPKLKGYIGREIIEVSLNMHRKPEITAYFGLPRNILPYNRRMVGWKK